VDDAVMVMICALIPVEAGLLLGPLVEGDVQRRVPTRGAAVDVSTGEQHDANHVCHPEECIASESSQAGGVYRLALDKPSEQSGTLYGASKEVAVHFDLTPAAGVSERLPQEIFEGLQVFLLEGWSHHGDLLQQAVGEGQLARFSPGDCIAHQAAQEARMLRGGDVPHLHRQPQRLSTTVLRAPQQDWGRDDTSAASSLAELRSTNHAVAHCRSPDARS